MESWTTGVPPGPTEIVLVARYTSNGLKSWSVELFTALTEVTAEDWLTPVADLVYVLLDTPTGILSPAGGETKKVEAGMFTVSRIFWTGTLMDGAVRVWTRRLPFPAFETTLFARMES